MVLDSGKITFHNYLEIKMNVKPINGQLSVREQAEAEGRERDLRTAYTQHINAKIMSVA